MNEGEVVVLERAALPLALVSRWQAVQPFGLEDAVDGIAVQVRQEVRHHKGEVIEGKASGLPQGADNGPLLVVAFQGSL